MAKESASDSSPGAGYRPLYLTVFSAFGQREKNGKKSHLGRPQISLPR